jgi:hypothetical protein
MHYDVSIPNAKDARVTEDNDIVFLMKAQARLDKRDRIMAPRQPIRLSKYGMFIIGLIAGALIATLIAFVISVTGLANGIAVTLGVAMTLGVIGTSLGTDE